MCEFPKIPLMIIRADFINDVWEFYYQMDYNVVFVFGEGCLYWPFPYWEPEA